MQETWEIQQNIVWKTSSAAKVITMKNFVVWNGYRWVRVGLSKVIFRLNCEHSDTIMSGEFTIRWATTKCSRRCLLQATTLQFSKCVLQHAFWLGKSPEGESDNSILVGRSVLYYGPSHIMRCRGIPTGTLFFTDQLPQRVGSVTSTTKGW
jgi:hypothetical protein